MPCVERVVVCDESGADIQQIQETCRDWAFDPKLKLHKNTRQLGAYFNKQECVKKAHEHASPKGTGCWVALIDSDNFAPLDTFFIPWLNYVTTTVAADENKVYAPASNIDPATQQKTDFSLFNVLDSSNVRSAFYRFRQSFTLLNTGNYIVHSSTYLRRCDLLPLMELVQRRRLTASDVAIRALALFSTGAVLQIVPGMSYEHSVHDDSLFAVHGASLEGRRDMNTIFSIAAKMQADRMAKEGLRFKMTPLPPKSEELRPRK